TYLQVSIPEFIIHNLSAVIDEIKRQVKESDESLSQEELNKIIQDNKNLITNRLKEATKPNNSTYLLIIKEIPKISKEAFTAHKNRVQKGFKENKFPLMVATKSFGMGIDKDNIFYTIHYGIPASVESLYQEAGRAGRWDKNKEENKNKKGKCYVLFSPETYNPKEEDTIIPFDVMKIFDQQTTIQEIRNLQNQVYKDGKDVFAQIYLFLQGLRDVEEDLNEVIAFKNEYFQEGVTKFVEFRGTKDREEKEKFIYRLSLLGLVKDWTNDFTQFFEVTFDSEEENHILKSLENYIGKYEPTKDIKSEIENVNEETFLKKATKYLLQWIFDHIVYNRKQSLKTLYDWCLDFKGSDDFKARLDSYFVFNDVTAILQTIGEKPFEYEQWFKVFYYQESTNEIKEGNYVSNSIFIPAIKDNRLKNEKYRNLQDAVSRFLESYQNNVGLNFVSGLIRLVLDDFNNSDGEPRFKEAFKSIKNDKKSFSAEHQNFILEKLVDLGSYFKTEQKEILCDVIKEYYPDKLEFFAERFDLPYLLCDNYLQRLQKIRSINTKLYEQIRTIR
uniref:helicase-related protein n=1 Tax=uncultured Capnocytophaga sp. TaxID=159273 RepID=UPI0025934C47